MKKAALLAALGLFLVGCATYPYANNVKMIGFSDEAKKGKTIGSVEGQDCQWVILGYPLSEPPRLDRAMRSVRDDNNVKYVNKVSSKNDGFDAIVAQKNCVTITGVGYR
ncbi:MAG: hypothetical protein HRT45_10215 [Bdellovibrionales bacterium]|nr:hypothetical protein [Bdellovibrionales bacterium]